MKKFFTTILFGSICFLSGVVTQYILPVGSWETNLDKIECEDKEIAPPELEITEVSEFETKEQEIRSYAQKITVKVFSGHNSGSGILIHRQGNIYQVITNDHVLLFGRQDQSYKIKAPNGKIYPATVVNQFDFQKYDLGIIEFSSEDVFEVASLSQLSSPNIGEMVYAAGFPYDLDNSLGTKSSIESDPSESETSIDKDFAFNSGEVNLISELSFRGGYQIGYTNDIKKGMSGGPLFNAQGQIIGINGRHKYPAWGNPYIFDDGTIASPEQKEQMSQYSWAIPIETFLRLSSQFTVNSKFNQY